MVVVVVVVVVEEEVGVVTILISSISCHHYLACNNRHPKKALNPRFFPFKHGPTITSFRLRWREAS